MHGAKVKIMSVIFWLHTVSMVWLHTVSMVWLHTVSMVAEMLGGQSDQHILASQLSPNAIIPL
jgi:hypothetical protein